MSATEFLQLGGGTPHNPPKPPNPPKPARRNIVFAMAGLAAILAGGVVLDSTGGIVLGSHSQHFVAPQKPGPRKFPPAYWGGGHWRP